MLNVSNNIRIVLVNTSHPGNIGAAARAMKTMGIMNLCLVQPQQYPCAEATARAAGADDVLVNARVCGNLLEAVEDCSFVIGTSARQRRLEVPMLSPMQSAAKLDQYAQKGYKVALVFGRERSGLTNEELDACQSVVNIPSNPDYSSLNLAAAVQILCYEIRQQLLAGESSPAERAVEGSGDTERLATSSEMEGLHAHLETVLHEVELKTADNPKQMLSRRLRRLFQRAQPRITEVNILRGVLSAVQGKKARRGNKT